MKTISYKLKDLDQKEKKVTLKLGYVGENEHVQIRIDCSEIWENYPNAVASLAVEPPEGSKYPAIVTREGNIVCWTVKDSDLVHDGDGRIQLTFTDGSEIQKTVICRTKVDESIIGSGTAPDPIADFVAEANEALAELEAAEVHGPVIGEDGYWYTWSKDAGEYVKTDTKAEGGEGPQGPAGKDGKDGKDGADGAPGQDGHTPVKGTDYWTQQDQADIVAAAALETVSAVIDDTAGSGDTNKVWSADKSADVAGRLTNAIDGLAPAVQNTVSGSLAMFEDGIAGTYVKNVITDFLYTREEGTPTPSNPKQIYGKTQLSIFNSGEDTSNSEETIVNWGNEIGTIYGVKSVDVIQGRMLVHIVSVDLGDINWIKQSGSAKDYFYVPISELEYEPIYKTEDVESDYKSACTVFKKVHQSDPSWGTNTFLFTNGAGTLPAKVLAVNAVKNEYADATAFKTAMSGQILIYEISEPFELEFTPVSIKTISGVNKFWNGTGREITVTYEQETTLYVEDKLKEISENTQEIKQEINRYTDRNLITGVVNYDGTIWGNTDYVTTDYIEIPTKYNRNLNYLHAFDEFSYAHYVGFYDENRQFIDRVAEISGCVRIISDDCKYIRVSFAAENEKRAIIFTNENINPQYEQPKKYIMFDNDLNSYNKFINSDGAVSAMIATGLMYFGDERFGYGTEHTLFATSCVKSTKDTHTESSGYSGERYQMDCSAYAQIMLMGITPECSRYFGTKNIQSPNGYRFNKLVQYEGYVYNVLQEGNTKRLYANSIAEYAYKNGYLFLIDDKFVNIRPGDVLFWSNQGSSYHFFEDIGHCGVVVDVVPMEDGSNTVVTFEGKGGTGSPCQFRTYSTRDDLMVYAARFPMPYVHDDAVDIASFSSAVTTAISGSTDSVVDVATVQTTETLEAGKMYTVLIKCELPDNCYVQIKSNGMSYIGVSNDDVLKRPDGYYVFHIFSKKSDTLTETGSITIQAHCTGAVSDDAVLSKMRVYEGFVTPMFG